MVAPLIFDGASKWVLTTSEGYHSVCIEYRKEIYCIDITKTIQSDIISRQIQDMIPDPSRQTNGYTPVPSEVITSLDNPLVTIMKIKTTQRALPIGTSYNTCNGCIAYIITSTQCINTSVIGNSYEELIPSLTVTCPPFIQAIGAPLINHYGQVIGIVAYQDEAGLCRCYYIDVIINLLNDNRTTIVDPGIRWKVINSDRILIVGHTNDTFTKLTNGIDNRYIITSIGGRNSMESIMELLYNMPIDFNFKLKITDLLTSETKNNKVILKRYNHRLQRPLNLKECILSQGSTVNNKINRLNGIINRMKDDLTDTRTIIEELRRQLDELRQAKNEAKPLPIDIILD